jgi:hypothetical protein
MALLSVCLNAYLSVYTSVSLHISVYNLPVSFSVYPMIFWFSLRSVSYQRNVGD